MGLPSGVSGGSSGVGWRQYYTTSSGCLFPATKSFGSFFSPLAKISFGYGSGFFENFGSACYFAQTDFQIKSDLSLSMAFFQPPHQLPTQGQVVVFAEGQDLAKEGFHFAGAINSAERFDNPFNSRYSRFCFVLGHRNNIDSTERNVKKNPQNIGKYCFANVSSNFLGDDGRFFFGLVSSAQPIEESSKCVTIGESIQSAHKTAGENRNGIIAGKTGVYLRHGRSIVPREQTAAGGEKVCGLAKTPGQTVPVSDQFLLAYAGGTNGKLRPWGSSSARTFYDQRHRDGRLFGRPESRRQRLCIGDNGIRQAPLKMVSPCDKAPDYVVVGETETYDYRQIEKAINLVSAGQTDRHQPRCQRAGGGGDRAGLSGADCALRWSPIDRRILSASPIR